MPLAPAVALASWYQSFSCAQPDRAVAARLRARIMRFMVRFLSMEVMDSARGTRRGLRLQCDSGVAECLDQRKPRTAEREVLAWTQHHVARVVLLGDPDRSGVRGYRATRAIAYAQKSSALQIDFHRRSFRFSGCDMRPVWAARA